MISWIQQTFQHHFKLVFGVLLATTIISFIFVIGASPGIGRAERNVQSQKFFNLNLASQEDMRRLQLETQVSVELQFGTQGFGGEQVLQYGYVRTACLYLADKLHVPTPTKTELADAIQKLRMFAGQDGKFDPKRYADFRKSLEKNPQITETDIARIVGDNIRIERVQRLVAGPGFSLPSDVRSELERADTSWTLQVAKIDRTSYAPSITPTEAELTKYFEDNSFRYAIPPQVLVSYVDFPASAFTAGIKVSEADAKAYFDANPARFSPPAETDPAKKAAPAPKVEFAQVKDKVTEAMVYERAARIASEVANRFAVAIDERKLVVGSPQFEAALAEYKVVARPVPAFSAETVPAELGANPQIAEEAFRLNKDRTVSDPVQTERGEVVLFFRGTLPSTQPAFAQVRAKVSADYIENERSRRFVALGATLRSQIATRIKSGDTFEKAVQTVAGSQGLKVDVSSYPAFTLRKPPQDLDQSVYAKLDTLKDKDISELTVSGESGVLVFAADRKVPDLSEANPSYVEMRARVAQTVASSNASEYFQDIITRELTQARPATIQ